MPDSDLQTARRLLEGQFRPTIDRDVTWAAVQRCNAHDLRAVGGYSAAERCPGSHEVISDLVWRPFLADWAGVVYIYDHAGDGARFLAMKTATVVEYAQAGAHLTPRVRDAAARATRELSVLWPAWAGYMATTSDVYAPAVREGGPLA